MKQTPDVSRDSKSAHSPFVSVWGEEHTCTAPLHNTQLCDLQPHFLIQQQINASSQSAALPPWFFTFTFCSKHKVNILLWQRQQGWILSRVVILRFIYFWHICLQLQLCCLSTCLFPPDGCGAQALQSLSARWAGDYTLSYLGESQSWFFNQRFHRFRTANLLFLTAF